MTEKISGWSNADAATAAQEPASENIVWDGNAKTYEWDDEFGDVGPKVPELEIELFGEKGARQKTGLDFSKIEAIEVSQEGPVKINYVRQFADAGLHPVLLENIGLAGYTSPTPIQKYTIPSIMEGYDIIGVAQTGSGKTAAYLIPILSKLMGKAKKLAAPRPNPLTFREGMDEVRAEPLVLIVVPTRELAVQIFNEARRFCYRSMLRPCVVYGGTPVRDQIALLGKGCDILVGTPGRLIDFINRPRVLTLRRLKYMVIDEADELLEWEDELKQILLGGDQDEGAVKYALFSATFPEAAQELGQTYLASDHVQLRVGRVGSTTENIRQIVVKAGPEEKQSVLVKLLEEMPGIRTIIFCNSRGEVDRLDDFLFHMGLPVTSMHRDRSQAEREAALRAFRSGMAPILIATGVTARGIDVRNVMHVINYDIPSSMHGGMEEYTHRIGRTGRIGHRGVATSIFTDRDEDMAKALIQKLKETNQEVPEFLESYGSNGFSDSDGNYQMTGSDSGTGQGEADPWGSSANTAAPPGDLQTDAWGASAAPAAVSSDPWGASAPQAALGW